MRKAAARAATAVVAGGMTVATAAPAAAATDDYTCDGLTSGGVESVAQMLGLLGVDETTVKGPIGVACTTESGDADAPVQVRLTGVDIVVFTCASAEEKLGKTVVFFNDCTDEPTPTEE